MSLRMQDLMLPVIAAGAAAACIRATRGRSRGTSGAVPLGARVASLGWAAALLVLSLLVMSAVYPLFSPNLGGDWFLLAIPLAAALILILRPRLARLAVPATLILFGIYGVTVARDSAFSVFTGVTYGISPVGTGSMQFYLVLPQAYGFLLLGGWLAWRYIDRSSPAARVLFGRLAQPERPGQLWAFLLVPLSIMAGMLLSPNVWLASNLVGIGWTVLGLGCAWGLVRRLPDLAAGLAVAGLVGLGAAGLYVAVGYSGNSWTLPVTHSGYVLDGLVDVTSKSMADLAFAQAIATFGLAVWLVPRAVPSVMRLLGRADAELVSRVQTLTASRAVAVDTAAADLRRLERDLHDGAQARLVALGMNLRALERLIPTSPDAALALVAEARETSTRALTELRELVRGVHPPVLADRGLADALRALALDSPLRIESDIDLPGRLPAPIETACYFAVAELLTNAVKHSGARDARITAEQADGVLRISVTDLGVGGADPAQGTGLAGVERRLATFDGILAVSSPIGGPTMVVIEVPCAISSSLAGSLGHPSQGS